MLPALIARYADRLHAAIGSDHHVASPLGAWLVLALAAGARPDPALEDALGCSAADARGYASALLEKPHPAVGAAAAVWTRADRRTPALQAWEAGLSAAVERGPVPSQADADAWTAGRTGGLIEKFPLPLDAQTVLVLASALATDVDWAEPFEDVPASALGRTDWELTTVLRSAPTHQAWIAADPEAGDIAVHRAASGDAEPISVVSVIAAPDVPPLTVLRAAHRAADDDRRSLFDLPLGDGHAWTLAEEPVRTTSRTGREERCEAILPAWDAESTHDLMDAGFREAAAALFSLLAPEDDLEAEAVQTALARYTKTGFAAAAVTALGVRSLSYVEPRDGVRRTATLRFGRPYAVVAVANQPGGPWDRVPVFSAWVTQPSGPTPPTHPPRT
ncbi:hypothetical protein [Cryptosporangium phraense]|uniref:Serpin family protein n=1 Tax=Cryptosporangium phraense TaxID=2593070 RepID=A0A545AHX0_9ACTN|nr:hypothetical protein [Cryptosporangium phraense]TQS40285.1 hypothetical protein FL583_35820 [Cryptosporangium phraense]